MRDDLFADVVLVVGLIAGGTLIVGLGGVLVWNAGQTFLGIW